jgi:hypothetical protein
LEAAGGGGRRGERHGRTCQVERRRPRTQFFLFVVDFVDKVDPEPEDAEPRPDVDGCVDPEAGMGRGLLLFSLNQTSKCVRTCNSMTYISQFIKMFNLVRRAV